MKCSEWENKVQGTGTKPGEMQEEPGQESPHRASRDLQSSSTMDKGDVDGRLKNMMNIIISYASERFGHIEKGKTKPTIYAMNRRATKMHQLRQELQTLKKQYKSAIQQ